MEFLVVGLNHHTAPLDVREKLAVGKAQLSDALNAMGTYVDQGVILSTCNRSEVYTLGSDGPAEHGLKEFLTDYYEITSIDVDRYVYCHRHGECVRHLFRVASSLDSMILGEGQILRQVRDAFEAASESRCVQSPLSHLFHQALRVGKRVRRDTGISRHASSVSRACVELARQRLGDLRQLKGIVIGTGDAGKLAAMALKESGLAHLAVTNRTHERALELAQELDGEAIPFRDMDTALQDVDIVIGSTGSPGYVLEGSAISRTMATRPQRPLFLIDIAVPRDIDPAAAQLDNVFLYDVDDLQTISAANRLERERQATRAEEMVDREVEQFLEWHRTLKVVPTIASLRKRAEEIRERELERLLKRLDHKLTPMDIESLETMTRAIVNKLLHEPTTHLREHHSSAKIQLARELFNLEDEIPSDSQE